jgi:hypothetical protein
MPVTLGRNGDTPPFGSNVISATYTEECDAIDITNRINASGGYKSSKQGFVTKTWEIECHDASGLQASLEATDSGFYATSLTENISVDGAVTFSVTVKEMA